MVCLNSWVNDIWGGVNKNANPTSKTSCKGTHKKRNELLNETFLDVLYTQDPHYVENAHSKKAGYDVHSKKARYGILLRKTCKVLSDGVTASHFDI